MNHHALATRIAQRLAGPAETILGFQRLIVGEIRRAGLPDAVADAEKVLNAAQDLEAMIMALISPEGRQTLASLDDATLRHDLRTPVNAILGYSELILEEWGDRIDPGIAKDIAMVTAECAQVLEQIDKLVEFSRGDIEALEVADSDAGIAEGLARTLSHGVSVSDRPTAGQILVIDDIPANRELLRRNLELRGHTVTAVASAQAALRALEHTSFELALVDILMPDMNGIELLGLLKAEPRWRDMSVVMVSGLKDVQAVVRCIKAGAEDYLQKPVDPFLLHARVESCLEKVRWRARERKFLEQIEYEKARADGLLLSMLPETVIERLGLGETVIADRFDDATIVFADIVDFTPLVGRTDPAELVGFLHDLFSKFDDLADRHGVEKIKTIGDAYMAVAGVPEPQDDHAHRALGFARSLIGVMSSGFGSIPPLKIRVGLSSGPVIAGLIGQKRFVYDVWGETVNLASRLESSGHAGRIQISHATLEALKSAPPKARAQDKVIKGVGPVRTFLID